MPAWLKKVSAFLQANPNVRIHYTPTYSSWLNQVEKPVRVSLDICGSPSSGREAAKA
jgi:hypothetical protein